MKPVLHKDIKVEFSTIETNYFDWLDDNELKYQLIENIIRSKKLRKETQKEVSRVLNISLTKIKEIENGKCKDFNSINNYINYILY